jgi:parallel beta-helix repeat protein
VNDSTVEGVACRSCRSGGLVTAATRRTNVRDFTACDNQFDGLACYQTEDCHFSGLRLHDNLAAGISLDLSFNHNVIEDVVLTGNDLGVFMRDSRDNSFLGLTISKSRKNGVFMAQTAGPISDGVALRPGTECTGNSFKGLMITDCGGDAFLVNDTSCKDNLVGDARFEDNRGANLSQTGGELVSVEKFSRH